MNRHITAWILDRITGNVFWLDTFDDSVASLRRKLSLFKLEILEVFDR